MLAQRLLKSSPHHAPSPLFAAELSLLTSHNFLHPLLPFATNIIPLATKYTSSPRGRTNAAVWLARLNAERAFGDASALQRTCKDARASIHGDGVVDIWLWAVRAESVQDEESAKQSLRDLEVIEPRLLSAFVDIDIFV